jgi:hypothetical protein
MTNIACNITLLVGTCINAHEVLVLSVPKGYVRKKENLIQNSFFAATKLVVVRERDIYSPLHRTLAPMNVCLTPGVPALFVVWMWMCLKKVVLLVSYSC